MPREPYYVLASDDGVVASICLGDPSGSFECVQSDGQGALPTSDQFTTFIGDSPSSICSGFRGEIDEVAFYSYALPPEAFGRHFAVGSGLPPDKPPPSPLP
ncbi:MAG TPA: hypothetical protein VFS43_32270 [Polyangiaceae bacterium]|nr:hypothetical protein [Polyangiaceae bacterium]